jgi:RND superfamily putative drug exporter
MRGAAAAAPPRPSPAQAQRRQAHVNLAASAGRWSARHRRVAILGWLAFVTAAFIAGHAIGERNLTDAQLGTGQSATAIQAYEGAFPFHTGEEVLVQGTGTIRASDPMVAAAVTELTRRLAALRTVGDIESPLSSPASPLRSRDGRSVLLTFSLSGDNTQAEQNVKAALAATAATARAFPRLRIEEYGTASATNALVKAYDHDFANAEHSSLPVTLLILLAAFGSLVAAGVPLLLGFTAVLAALGLIAPLSHLVPVMQGQIGPVVLLIGLAVGVDYSMFYLRRKLEERREGLSGEAALARAAATSGQAVLISGLTVMTAMAGMLFAGDADFSSLAMGTMSVVAVAVLGSITVLPAVLAALGDSVEKGRVPIIAARRARGTSPTWRALVEQVLKRPALSAGAASAALLLVASPALAIHTVDPGTVGMPPSLPIMATYHRIGQAFPGAPMPAEVVVQAPDVTAPAVRSALVALSSRALASRELAGPVIESVSADHKVAVLSISLAGNGTDAASVAALSTLRSRLVPETIGRLPGVSADVAGYTAGSQDFNSTMKAHLPDVFGFVLGVAFLILLVTFRSLVIPLLTILLDMLSVAAAYGVLVLIFQDGWLRSLIGAQDIGGVVDWVPLFLFVVLFGLSMDYHVLILSRVREGHDRGLDTADAVANGIASTAGIITSAAVVMIAVFAIFATLNEIIFKELGIALSVAVLIDATVVRIVILPSAMKLLGEWSWYLPGRGRQTRGRLAIATPAPFAEATAGRRPAPPA